MWAENNDHSEERKRLVFSTLQVHLAGKNGRQNEQQLFYTILRLSREQKINGLVAKLMPCDDMLSGMFCLEKAFVFFSHSSLSWDFKLPMSWNKIACRLLKLYTLTWFAIARDSPNIHSHEDNSGKKTGFRLVKSKNEPFLFPLQRK